MEGIVHEREKPREVKHKPIKTQDWVATRKGHAYLLTVADGSIVYAPSWISGWTDKEFSRMRALLEPKGWIFKERT